MSRGPRRWSADREATRQIASIFCKIQIKEKKVNECKEFGKVLTQISDFIAVKAKPFSLTKSLKRFRAHNYEGILINIFRLKKIEHHPDTKVFRLERNLMVLVNVIDFPFTCHTSLNVEVRLQRIPFLLWTIEKPLTR